MKRLKFTPDNWYFRKDSLQFTIRRGVGKATMEPGEKISLQCIGLDNTLFIKRKATVDQCQVFRFSDIPEEYAEHWHLGRNYDAMCWTMAAIYPGFHQNELVTLVWFRVI